MAETPTASASGTFDIGGKLTVNRLGFGAMRLAGEDIIGAPDNEESEREVLRRAVELGVNFLDTADSYGPGVSERLIGDTLTPYEDVTVATKGRTPAHAGRRVVPIQRTDLPLERAAL